MTAWPEGISRSYPHMSIAKKHGVAYGDVLVFADYLADPVAFSSNPWTLAACDRIWSRMDGYPRQEADAFAASLHADIDTVRGLVAAGSPP